MSTLEDRYRRLLRWYPRTWRERNGDALIGTALDAAEAEGRTHPDAAEARTMIMHGIAERATVRVALAATVVALLCAASTQVILITAVQTVGQWGGGWIPLALSSLASLLQTVAVLAMLRHAGLLRPGLVVPVLLVAMAAWAFAFFSAWSWSAGFDRADAGLAHTPFTGSIWLFALSGWVLGGIAIAAMVSEAGPAAPAAARAASAVVAGVLLPPVLGLVTVFASASGLTSLILIVFCIRMMTPRTRQEPPAAAGARSLGTTASPLGRRGRVVALGCAIVGLASVIFALAGASVVPTIDTTRAMQLGLGAGALTGIPLLWLAATRLTERHPMRRTAIRCAIALIAAGVAVEAVHALSGAGGSGDFSWASVTPAAAGIGLLTWTLAPLSRGLRLVLAAAVAAAVFFPLWLALTAAGMLFPPIAVIVVIRAFSAVRRGRGIREASRSAGVA